MTGVLGKVTGWMSSPSAKLRRAQRLLDEGHRAEAFPLLARVAQTGNAEAEFLVARAYLEGSGVPPNATEAEATSYLAQLAAPRPVSSGAPVPGYR